MNNEAKGKYNPSQQVITIASVCLHLPHLVNGQSIDYFMHIGRPELALLRDFVPETSYHSNDPAANAGANISLWVTSP